MAVEIVFTFITLISAGLTLLVTFPLIILMMNYLRRKQDVVLLLMANTYITMFAHCLLVFLAQIDVLRADLYGPINTNISDTTACRLLGFLLYVTFGWCYISFVLQAFYRFARVLYAKQKIFQSFKFNLSCIFLQWIIGFLIQLPVFIWPVPIYTLYKLDYYCGIPYEKFWAMFYVAANIFFNPIIFLTIIYACLLYFIRHQSPQLLQTQQGKKFQRDFIVTRRILFIVNILTLPGLPNVVFFAMTNINPNIAGHYHMYRIQWMGPPVIIFTVSVALLIMTPQLKALIMTGVINPENQMGSTRQTINREYTRTLPAAGNQT